MKTISVGTERNMKKIALALATLLIFSGTLIGCSVQPTSSSPSTSGSSELAPKKIEDLQREVDSLLATKDPVLIRRKIEIVFELIDRLIELQRKDEAFNYLEEALKHKSWDLNHQVLYAEMLQAKGQYDLARTRAELVLGYSEKDKEINRARKLLGQESLPSLPKIQEINETGIAFVLVPVGEADVCVLQDLQDVLTKKLHIPVSIYEANVSVPAFKRDLSAREIDSLRDKLRKGMNADSKLANFVRRLGITDADLNKDAVLIDVWRKVVYTSGGDDEVSKFDNYIRTIKRLGKQWNIEDLIVALRFSVRPYLKSNLYFLGVTNLDTFSGQSNFIFGSVETGGHHGIISYRRFTADFNDEDPNRKRLIERTFKQSLSSIGFMLGIKRCSQPTCARTYPHSLSEHDAKTTNLCDECRRSFEEILGTKVE